MRSDWRHSIVDLTEDFDDDLDEEGVMSSLPVATAPTARPSLPLPTPPSMLNAPTFATRPTNIYVPQPESTSRNAPLPATLSTTNKQIHNGLTAPTSSSRPPTSAGMGCNGATPKHYVPRPASSHNSTAIGAGSAERAAKRMRVSTSGEGVPAQSPRAVHQASAPSFKTNFKIEKQWNGEGPHRSGGTVKRAQAGPAPSRASNTSANGNSVNKIPSVQYINQALKTNGTNIPFVDEAAASRPRPLEIGRISQEVDLASPIRPSSGTTQTLKSTTPHADGEVCTDPQTYVEREEHKLQSVTRNSTRPRSTEAQQASKQTQSQNGAPTHSARKATVPREADSSRPRYFSGPTESPRDDDKDSVMSDVPTHLEAETQRPTDRIANSSHPVPATVSTSLPTPVAQPPKPTSGRKKFTNQFTEEQDHYLIFLKEVKRYGWKQITEEYNAELPYRAYSALQSHYSTCLNKRDRSQDPAILTLPPRFATEAVVDWQTVHASNPGPRARFELNPPPQKTTTMIHQARQPQLQEHAASRPFPIHQTTEHDYSSGADSAPRRERSRRAQRVNYTWPRTHRRAGGAGMNGEDEGEDEAVFEDWANLDTPTRSETPAEEAALPVEAAVTVDNDPINMDFEAEDAKIALSTRKGPRDPANQTLPYLTASQRLAIRKPSAEWDWNQLSSRQWQGCLLHVDFGPSEIEVVEKAITKMKGSSQKSRHNTRRRHVRALLTGVTEPKCLQLVSELRRRLPQRDKGSIMAFLQDGKAGKIADVPQCQRLAAAKPQRDMSTSQKVSTSSMIRQRESGHQSRRVWQAASKPITYQVKNKYIDTLGSAFSWTGASGDTHTVSWAPDGECFAVGAVAVDDPDSMQYNRPNNLLYGDSSCGTIHELGEHYKDRKRTESGANSTHAMFVSQDPRLYTTVSSVAFSTSGKLMYSAGYDETICVWHTNTESAQPLLGAKLRVKAQVDMMAVNRTYDGVLATAAKITGSKAVRMLTIDEETPSQFGKHNFHSSKAASRSDLNILPTVLQFEPKFGGLLLAGFGANKSDVGFDMTGDLCVWDVETQTQLPIYGSNRNVFDVDFNPNRSYMPLFAVGCVADGNVNRGTRSVLRLYDEKVDRYWCPLEIECKALDMNDVVWCPHDEYLIAAGCTNGRTYVWDVRWPTDPIRTLSHGRSLMPLQDGVAHELTDTGVRFLSWGENATRLYSGSSDGVVKVWDVTRSEEDTFIKDLITLDSGTMSGAFSPDMSKLLVGEVNGSVNVLEVGRDDCSIKDAAKLQYVPYDDQEEQHNDSIAVGPDQEAAAKSGVHEGNYLLQTGQLQTAPMGSLPVRQVVRGPNYTGPYDQSVDAPFLREQALEFQLSFATGSGPQCDIAACKESINKVTSEEIGASGRSADRIPNELSRAWKAVDITLGIVPGKSKCTHCGRPARPSFDHTDANASILCERCSFACFRCGAVNPIAPATTIFICDSCAGVWEIGALGYECIDQPVFAPTSLDVPSLKNIGKESYLERLDTDTTFGDEMNALTDYYHSLAIDRPESPPL